MVLDLSTKSLIKFLPFDEEFKLSLLERFDSLPLEQRAEIDELAWDAYYAIYELKLDENIETALLEDGEKREKLDKDFYNRIRKKTEEQMQQEEVQNVEQFDLSDTREKLEKIIENTEKN